jgi:hypothetical protein
LLSGKCGGPQKVSVVVKAPPITYAKFQVGQTYIETNTHESANVENIRKLNPFHCRTGSHIVTSQLLSMSGGAKDPLTTYAKFQVGQIYGEAQVKRPV